MTRIATMGTSSCATIAIAGFKDPHYVMNEQYRADPNAFELPEEGLTVQQFQDQVITPIKQPLGHTKEYPFDMLMKAMDKQQTLAGKFIIITLNSYQMNNHDGYWVDRLTEWGFEKIDTTKNNQGGLCTVFTRNRSRPA